MRKAAPVVLALALAVSCTGSGDGAVGIAALREAADEARAAGTVRVTTETTLDHGATESLRRGEGAYDFDAEAGTLATEQSTASGGQAIEQPVDVIVYGSDVYQRYPESSPKWHRSDLGAGFILDAGLVPARYLDALAAVDGADVEVGDAEELDGVSATRYDLSSGAFDDLAGPLGLDETHELESVAVWIDGDGLARRLELALTLENPAGETQVTATLELNDYGADVAIEPPEDFEESP